MDEFFKNFYAPENMQFATAYAKYKWELNFSRFTEYVCELERMGNGWAFLALLIRRKNGCDFDDRTTPIHPDVAKDVLNTLGLYDPELLKKWLESFNSSNVTANAINSVFSHNVNIPTYEEKLICHIDELLAIAKSGWLFENDCQMWQKDNDYVCLTLAELQKLIIACPVQKLKYRAESRDCDDFAIAYRGWLSTMGYGNCAVADCEVNAYRKENQFEVAHDIVMHIVEVQPGMMQPLIVEPQNGAIYYPGSTIGLNCDYVRVRLLCF